MSRIRRTLLVFTIIFIQSAVAVTAGIAAIYLSASKSVPPGVYVGSVDIGGLKKPEAVKKLDEYYSASLKDRNIELKLDGSDIFSIPYSEVEASVDSGETLKFMSGWKAVGYLPDLLSAYFGKKNLEIVPVIKFNEGRLREKLIELSKLVDKEPVDAAVTLEDGKLVRKAEESGLSLNIENTVDVIRRQISSNPDKPVLLGSSKNYEIETISAQLRLKDLDDIQEVLAEYSTYIIDPELQESITASAKAINGIVIPAAGSGADNTFSFVDWLKKSDPDFENDNEGYDQVASTLYAAVLSAGIDKDGITRLAHNLPVEYIEPGLDAWISGNGGDLKFVNSFSHKVAVFAGVKGGKLTVSIAGNRADRKPGMKLITEVVQRFSPPVVNFENRLLKPGEKVVLSSGKEGAVIKVFRDQELISTDKYDAVKAIVQVGPDTGFSTDDK